MTRCLPLLMLVAVGCCDARLFHCPPTPLAAQVGPPAAGLLGEAAYRCGCGDVLAVTFPDHPDWDCLASVGLDGRLPLGPAGTPLAQGSAPAEVTAAVAAAAGVDADRVRVRLVEPRAGRIYLSGPENNRLRTVAYRGPEPVVEFLWRVGAVQPGCSDLRDVWVVRPNVAAGGAPQTFAVDIAAVVLDADHRTNVVLRPSDQVYVGETRRSEFGRLLPAWCRPAYRALAGMLPDARWPW